MKKAQRVTSATGRRCVAMLAAGGLVTGLFGLTSPAVAAPAAAPVEVVDGELNGWGWAGSDPWESTFSNDKAPFVDVATTGRLDDKTILAVSSAGELVTQGDFNGLVTLIPDALATKHVIAVDVFGSAAAAVTDDGAIYTWGNTVAAPDRYRNPTSPTGVVDVQISDDFGVALKSDGTLDVWGNANLVNKAPDVDNITQIAANGSNALALTADGKVYAWNDSQGTGGAFQVDSPSSNVVDIDLGGAGTNVGVGYALTSDGDVVTWGGSPDGVVPAAYQFPSDVTDPVIALSESAGRGGTNVALTDQGELVVWGLNPKTTPLPQVEVADRRVVALSYTESVHVELILGPEDVTPPEPGVISQPKITGDPFIGSSVTGTPATWNFTPTSQTNGWFSAATADAAEGDWTPVGETNPLALTEALDGRYVVYRSTAVHENGETFVANSDPIGPVEAQAPAVIEQPKIQGIPVFNSQAIGVAAKFNFTPTSTSSGWYVADSADAAPGDWTLVSEANPLKLPTSVIGKYVVFRTLATDSDGGSWSEDSEPIGPVVRFAATTPPSISGDLVVGSTLTGVPGEFSYQPESVSYTWVIGANEKSIPIAPGDPVELPLTSEYLGKTIKLFAQGTVAGLRATGFSTESAPVAPAPLAVSQDATITGTAKEGQTLTGTPATFGGGSAAITVTNQWLADGVVIEGATDVTLPLTAEHVGKKITFKSTAVAGEETVTSESVPTALVARLMLASTTTASVSRATSTWGQAHTVTVRVASTGVVPTGAVTIKVGSLVKKVTVNSNGVAVLAVPKNLRVGRYTVSAAYAGSTTVSPSKASARLTISKAAVSLAERFASRISRTTRARGVVTARVVGSTLKVGGTVKIYKGKRVVGKGALRAGRVTIRLIKLPKGKNKLVLRLAGGTNTKAAARAFVIAVR